MSDRMRVLTEARAGAWAKMNELRDAIGDKPATAEQRAEWERIEADVTAISADMRAEDTFLRTREAVEKPLTERIDPSIPVKEDGIDEKRYAEAFDKAMRWGVSGSESRLTDDERRMLKARFEQRAQGETTNSAGGYLVPQGYWEKITETLKAFGGLMGVANVIRTSSGQALPWPGNNDTTNLGALLSENTQIPEVDLTISQTGVLNAWTYTSNLILASLQLLNDSAFDLDTWLPKKIGQRLGRAVAADLVGGSGTSRPTGIDLAPTTGVTGGTGSTTATAWSGNQYGNAYNDLVNLEHSVDAAYRQMGNCMWLMNDLTLAAIRLIKDGQGRPLWDPNRNPITPGSFDTVLGYPVIVDNAMPVMAANAKSMLFGDFEQGYVVRQVLDPTVMVLRERYADYLQVGYFGFQRIDGRPDDAAAVRAFVNSAT